ncbi:hypothetical protein ACFY8C_36155 [Streptomyces flavochromogenes]|uniref:Uncharacterized protein n=1 Tax=Streptomyces flavochromogenes TaxID=68199 RepID=A0ABW6Y1T6_9ACTN|nr:hypothetical protein [Streptomyces flavochromogenes]
MSASEKSGQNPFPWTGPYAVPDYPAMAETYGPDTAEAYGPATSEVHAGTGELRALPDLFPEKGRTAAQAVRGAGNTLWTEGRAHKAATAGAVAGAAAALTLAYAMGRRAGRRRLGPVALFFERRF